MSVHVTTPRIVTFNPGLPGELTPALSPMEATLVETFEGPLVSYFVDDAGTLTISIYPSDSSHILVGRNGRLNIASFARGEWIRVYLDVPEELQGIDGVPPSEPEFSEEQVDARRRLLAESLPRGSQVSEKAAIASLRFKP